ncbi:uncharacterized protein [Macrobrachium rosenbergii]|uniref:uncharacterized protein n=1 Tax=Macrobrachium rosenbergii TaxID=79674 RepID=UPI0034D588AB
MKEECRAYKEKLEKAIGEIAENRTVSNQWTFIEDLKTLNENLVKDMENEEETTIENHTKTMPESDRNSPNPEEEQNLNSEDPNRRQVQREAVKESKGTQNEPTDKERPTRAMCRFFRAGKCMKGDSCEYLHNWKSRTYKRTQYSQDRKELGQRIACRLFKRGHCKYGRIANTSAQQDQ